MISLNSLKGAKKKARHLAEAAIGKKGFNLIILEIGRVNPFTDCFLLVSGRSDRHVQAIADTLYEDLKTSGGSVLGVEGYEEGKWVLIDAGDVIIHIFQEAVRNYYDLEGLWIDAPSTKIDDDEDEKSDKEVVKC
jgi:ribosome-associated protein